MLLFLWAIVLFMDYSACAFLKVGSSESVQAIWGVRCPHGEFPCNSTETCVEQRKNCDGTADCDDGSDEWFCEDSNRKEFWNNLFKKRPDEDREKIVEGCSLPTVPEQCGCASYKLFCENQNLQRPPEDLPLNLEELDLSGNKLLILDPTHFRRHEKLHTLIIKLSEVTFVTKDSFKSLPNLQDLYLTANNIAVIVNGTLAANAKLMYLDLSHNPLSVLSPGAFDGLKNLKELDIRDCHLKSLPAGVFDSLVNMKILWFDGNQLTMLTKNIFKNNAKLEILSLSRNKLQIVHMNGWFGLDGLRSLSLSQNQISMFDWDSFGNLTSLRKLDAHANRIRTINENAFLGLTKLESLNLRMNELRKPKETVFDPLVSLTHIYFDDFHLCSLALSVRVCEPRGDGISSVAHLLDSVVLRVAVWAVAAVAALGNIAVLVGRAMLAEPNAVHAFYIKNLALADLMMAAYLFAIAAHDVCFRGRYLQEEARWRRSWRCRLFGALATLSSEASVLVIAVITADRYMSIMHPLSVKKRTLQSAALSMMVAWGFAALLSALPLLDLGYYGPDFYGNNGVCLPLQIHAPFGPGWEYSAFVFCGLNLGVFALVATAYAAMFSSIARSQAGLRCSQQQQDRAIARRFALIVATDCLCWVPIVAIKTVAMAGAPVQEDLYAWVAVFLLPVNSALNPVLYTLTTKLFRQQLARAVVSLKVSNAGSGDSVTPSCARNHSLRSHKGSFTPADHNNIALVMSRACPDCRHPSLSRQISATSEGGCRRHSSKRRSSHNNIV